MNQEKIRALELIARKVRSMLFRTILTAGSGHLGGSSSSTELMVGLYFGGILKYDPFGPQHPGRDRVLVRGHLGPLRYSIFNLLGWIDEEELFAYRNLGSRLQGHESMDVLPGIDITPSGMLGMILSYSTGAAIALKKQAIPATVWVFLGDGEEQEGNISEAARHIANLRLDNLVCIMDRNQKQLSQPTRDVDGAADLRKIWEGYGWHVKEIADGNSVGQILEALKKPRVNDRPTLFIAHTIKGKGLCGSEDHPSGYHTLSTCPKDVVEQAIDTEEAELRSLAKDSLSQIIADCLSKISRPTEPHLTTEPIKIDFDLKKTDIPEDGLVEYFGLLTNYFKDRASRLYILTADVTVKKLASACGFNQPHVNYIDPGIREQHLLAMAHGIAVSDPNARIIIIEGDPFLFRAIDQLNAISQAGSRMIVIGSDSGLCEARNGSTHQTAGQPGAMLHMSGLAFLEPADVIDLQNCLNWALNEHSGPVYLRLHNSSVTILPTSNENRNLIAYSAFEPKNQPRLVIVASGLPVGEAVKLATTKDQQEIGIRVINVIDLKSLGADFASLLIENVPVLTVYNGNPTILQSPVAKAVMENFGPKPSVILGHGFYLGTSGKLPDLLRYFHLDAQGIEIEINRRFGNLI